MEPDLHNLKDDMVAFIEHPLGDSERGAVCVVDRAGHKRNLEVHIR